MIEIVKSDTFFPMCDRHTRNFITYLFDGGMHPSTITTYLSGLSFFSKALKTEDTSNSFTAKKLLVAARRSTGSGDSRAPISPQMITDLITLLPSMNIDHYSRCLYTAMYILAFNAFLRVGEFTSKNKDDTSRILQLSDLVLMPPSQAGPMYQLTIKNFKGNVAASPVFLLLPPSPALTLCLHRAFALYLPLRGPSAGPLFITSSGAAVTADQFTAFLKLNLVRAGYSSAIFKTHSFRIGAASHASSLGISDETIMKLGRWKSLAFQKYIRLPSRTAHVVS